MFCIVKQSSKGDLSERTIKKEKRKIHQQLQNTLPRALYLESLEKFEESVTESGCRDEAPSPGLLKSISCKQRMEERRHKNESLSLSKMVEEKTDEPDEVLQKVLLHPKGVMLWSKRSIRIFHKRSKEDIVYLDATGSILKKAKDSEGPFYVYELVVRNPKKGSSPFPVATYVTCDHTTASILYFLSNMGKKVSWLCDGFMVLMQAISMAFCKTNLHSYCNIFTGKGTAQDFFLEYLYYWQ